MDYKETLNLPKTDFPMKADLPHREPLILEKWSKDNIYRLILKKGKSRPLFILHDGPPYANGNIHIGHALNKILKDIIVKYKTMRGFLSPFVPGWDCHGLPVEHQLFKELKLTKAQIGQLEFRKKAHEYALRFVQIQKKEFQRLGVFGDWDNPYLTLDKKYEESILRSLLELVRKGYIFRGLKPVNWCYHCETALAEAEVEYAEHSSPSIFVKFTLSENELSEEKVSLVIWTTTPWTLLSNVAVAAHPDFIYCFIKTKKEVLVVAEDLLPSFLQEVGIKEYQLVKKVAGSALEGKIYHHPFGARKGKVVLADYVSKDEGSGLVHIAPGHGSEDYLVGLKYNLEIIMPVDSKGNFDKSVGEFAGLNVHQADDLIIKKLQAQGALLGQGRIQHSYPCCWRCKSPIIFRATKQWFLKIDQAGLRRRLLEIIATEVKWIPASGQNRISAMVESRPDWCLSRQRYWGVPIPSLVCLDCGEEFLKEEVIAGFVQFVSQEGSDCWFKRDWRDFFSGELQCPRCESKNFSKGTDILDVWFDSGVSHQAVLKAREDLGRNTPCDLYLEGSDQHRGWFQASLIPSVCIDGRPPYRMVLTHGFVVDGEGRKMSKSLGNVISPQEIIKDFGADILRLWVASSDYNEDIRISPLILTRLGESYRKIRNTFRFILSNLYDFNPVCDRVDVVKLKPLDKLMLIKTYSVLDQVQQAYENFEFYKAYSLIYELCNEKLSMFYLDAIKGRLYTSSASSWERRSAQSTIYEIGRLLVRMVAPLLVFTSEEVWQYLPKDKDEEELVSVHLLDWPEVKPKNVFEDYSTIGLMELEALLPQVNKLLEVSRMNKQIGSSFDAQIILLTNSEVRYKFLRTLEPELAEFFRVSQVHISREGDFVDLVPSEAVSDIKLKVQKAQGEKCVRCWNRYLSVGKDPRHPQICSNCIKNIEGGAS